MVIFHSYVKLPEGIPEPGKKLPEDKLFLLKHVLFPMGFLELFGPSWRAHQETTRKNTAIVDWKRICWKRATQLEVLRMRSCLGLSQGSNT